MRKILVFLWLIVGMTVATVAQQIFVSSPGYGPRDVTKTQVNIKPGTEVNISVQGLNPGTTVYWANIPSGESEGQELPFVFDETEVVDIYVYLMNNGSLEETLWTKLVPNNQSVLGLLSQQNVSDCSGTSVSFDAADYSESYEYQWQRLDGNTWINVVSTANYVALGRNLTVFVNNNTEGMSFKAIVKNLNCLGAIEETGEVVIEEAYPLPTATFSPSDKEICAGEEIDLVVTPTAGIAPFIVTMKNGIDDLVVPYVSSTTVNTLGSTAIFSVNPIETITYNFTIVDDNGCQREY